MSEQSTEPQGMNRRKMLGGLGAATGAVGLAAVAMPGVAGAAPSKLPMLAPQALTPQTPGLSYLPIDAVAFFTATEAGRNYDVNYGTRPLVGSYLYTSPALPVGAVIKRLDIVYRGTPIVWLDRRGEPAPYWESLFTTTSLPLSLTAASASYDVDFTVTHGYTYLLRVAAEANNGITGVDSSIMGVTVGYVPPASGFMPYTGTTPRILDTRQGGGKVLPGDAGARELNLNISGAKAVVINLTADSTEAYGYFSVYPANIAYPGTSSLNWTGPNVTIANTVIAPLSPDGKIKLRAGESAAHAIVDVQGFLY